MKFVQRRSGDLWVFDTVAYVNPSRGLRHPSYRFIIDDEEGILVELAFNSAPMLFKSAVWSRASIVDVRQFGWDLVARANRP